MRSCCWGVCWPQRKLRTGVSWGLAAAQCTSRIAQITARHRLSWPALFSSFAEVQPRIQWTRCTCELWMRLVTAPVRLFRYFFPLVRARTGLIAAPCDLAGSWQLRDQRVRGELRSSVIS